MADGGHDLAQQTFLGLDIGSVNVRAAVIDRSGKIVLLDGERILNGPARAIVALLEARGWLTA